MDFANGIMEMSQEEILYTEKMRVERRQVLPDVFLDQLWVIFCPAAGAFQLRAELAA
jgi:hypothetical protein